MNRNTELHFGTVPRIRQNRSKFNMSHSIKTTFNTGDMVPIFVDCDILPGDTVQMDMSEIVRMATPIYPVMDNMIMDLYWFFVPHRLNWDNWAKFWGENDDPWIQENEYQIPQIEAPEGGWAGGTIADYMGLPTLVDNISVNALPFRAYAKVYNDWFRDENLEYNCHIYTDETTRTGTNGNDQVTDTELGGYPAKAAKLHDYFTSALPQPQKGPEVKIPLGTTADVKGYGTLEEFFANVYNRTPRGNDTYDTDSTHFTLSDASTPFTFAGVTPIGLDVDIDEIDGYLAASKTDPTLKLGSDTYAGRLMNTDYLFIDNLEARIPEKQIGLSNAYTDLSTATAATINALRTAFAIQKYYEAAGRNGTRYIEYLKSVFGVESSDARLQRSEYLGGQRIPLNMDQVLQTSSTDVTSPQGNTAGFSCTLAKDSMFTKSFEEHGTLLCIAVARVEHSYQQGLDKMWSRKKWTDFYNPYFANLGEMPILNKQIYCQGNDIVDEKGEIIDDQVFGYQEAWAEYRYKQNRVTGNMRSNAVGGSLDVWHYADDYDELPKLGTSWIREPVENVDRTIAVKSQVSNQFIADFYFKCAYTRCMPVYSVPGLIDHV